MISHLITCHTQLYHEMSVKKMEVIRYSGHPVTISLFFNVIFSLLVLMSFIQRDLLYPQVGA